MSPLQLINFQYLCEKKLKKEWFENWFDSSYYPILYKNRDVQEAEGFINRLFDKLQLPAHQKILDIACGEGRFAYQMAKRGHKVTGIDLSKNRIEIAKELVSDEVDLEFQVHDMRLPYYTQYFDYAFNFFTSFGYFKNMRDTQSAVRTMFQSLKKDGVLIIDYFNAPLVIKELISEEKIQRNNLTFEIFKKVEDKEIIKEIMVNDPVNGKHYFEERVSAFELNDFLEMFTKKQDFKFVKAYGNYNLSDYDRNNSPRLIMKFKK